MKNTFILTMMALAATAAAASGATLTAAPDALDTATTGAYTKNGFTLDFGKSAAFTLGDTPITDLSNYSNFQLTSVAITTTATNYGDTKLAVYKVADTSPSTENWDANPGIKNFESYVGVSSSVGTHANGQATYTFNNLSLDPTAWYAFIFVSSEVEESAYSSNSNLGSVTSDSAVSFSRNFTAYTNVDNGLVWGDMLNAGGEGKWNNTQTAVATYTFAATPASIPEPATATLSLLALAGLAARRRRK